MVTQLHRADAVVSLLGIRLGILALDSAIDRVQFRPGLLDVRARSQAAKKIGHAVHPAGHHGGGKMMRTGHHVSDDFGVRRVRHRRFQHADDGGRPRAANVARIQFERISDDRGIAVEYFGPEAVGQHHGAGGIRAVIVRVQ